MMTRYASDLSQTSENVLLDLFNVDFQKHLDTTKVKLSAPQSVVDTGSGDTTIIITPTKPCDLNGETRYYYNRVNLDVLLYDGVEIDAGQYRNVSDILKVIADSYGINISAREVYPKAITDAFLRGAEELVLKINLYKCVLYRGEIKVRVSNNTLASRILNTMLNGFINPEEILNGKFTYYEV